MAVSIASVASGAVVPAGIAGLLAAALSAVNERLVRVREASNERERRAAVDALTGLLQKGFQAQQQRDYELSVSLACTRDELRRSVGAHLLDLRNRIDDVGPQVDAICQEIDALADAVARLALVVEADRHLAPAVPLGFRRLDRELFAEGGGDDAGTQRRLGPCLFRPDGPNWTDFVYEIPFRRVEVDEILEHLADGADSRRVVVLQGDSASGKSVIARYVGYSLWTQGRPVYHAHFRGICPSGGGDLSNWATFFEQLETAIQNAREIFGSAGNTSWLQSTPTLRPAFIVEDLHCRGHRAAVEFLQVLNDHLPGGADFVVVTRPSREPNAAGEQCSSIWEGVAQRADRSRVWLLAEPGTFTELVRDLGPHIWRKRWELTGEPVPFALAEGTIQQLSHEAGGNLWLLVWMLSGHEGKADQAFRRRLALSEAERHLMETGARSGLCDIEARLPGKPVVAALVLATSVSSSYELAMDRYMLLEGLQDSDPDITRDELLRLVNALVENSELLTDAAGAICLPHASVADLYSRVAERKGENWWPNKWLASALHDHDWSMQLLARQLEQDDRELFRSLLADIVMRPEKLPLLAGHARVREALYCVSIKALNDSGDDSNKSWAAGYLARVADCRAVDALADALQDAEASEEVRRQSAYALASMGEVAVPRLVQAMGHVEWRVRDWAAFALGEIGCVKAIAPLIAALEDQQEHVRWGAARALGEIGHISALEPLREALQHGDEGLRACAADALGAMRDPAAAKALTRALQDRDGDGHVRSASARALGSQGTSGVPALIDALQDADRGVRSSAAFALGHIGDKRSVLPLIGGLDDGDADVRMGAAWALGELGDSRAVQPLIRALSDKDPRAASAATEALGRIRDPQALPHFINALGDAREGVRESAACALGELGKAEAVDALLLALSDQGFMVLARAAEALGKIGDGRAVGPLIDLVRSGGAIAEVSPAHGLVPRASAAWALGTIGDLAAVPALMEQFVEEDRDRAVVAFDHETTLADAAALGISTMGEVAAGAVAEGLGSSEPSIRLWSARILGHIGTVRETAALKVAAAKDGDHRIREEAGQAVRAIQLRRKC